MVKEGKKDWGEKSRGDRLSSSCVGRGGEGKTDYSPISGKGRTTV